MSRHVADEHCSVADRGLCAEGDGAWWRGRKKKGQVTGQKGAQLGCGKLLDNPCQLQPATPASTSPSSCPEPARFTLVLYSLSVVLTLLMSFSPEAPRPTAANVDQGACDKKWDVASCC